jgi:hypothetical protein
LLHTAKKRPSYPHESAPGKGSVQSKSNPVSETTAATVTGVRLARAPLGSDTAEAAAMAAPSSSAGDDAYPMAFVQGYNEKEIAVAGEFLTTWLPFLSAGLCPSCVSSLRARVDSLLPRGNRRPPLWPACRRTLRSLGFLCSRCLTPNQPPQPRRRRRRRSSSGSIRLSLRGGSRIRRPCSINR